MTPAQEKRLEEVRLLAKDFKHGLTRELLAVVDSLREELDKKFTCYRCQAPVQCGLCSEHAALAEGKIQECLPKLNEAFESSVSALRAANEQLREALTRAAADLRHGLAYPSSAGIVADVVRRLEQVTTPGAPQPESQEET